MDGATLQGPQAQVVDLAACRQRRTAASTAIALWAAAPVRYLPQAFLRATDGLFPGFSWPDLVALRALP